MTDRELRLTAIALLSFVGIMLAVQALTGGMSNFEGNGFEMDFPKGWKITEPPLGEPGNRWTATAGEFPLPTITIIYYDREVEPSLLKYFEETVLTLRTTVERFKLHSHSDIRLGDLAAKRTTFTWLNLDDGVQMQSLSYYFVARGRVWSITCTSANQFFPENRPLFEEICRSFELR